MTAVLPPALERGAALFLDFDGTLVEFAPRPDAVAVTPALRALLPRLQAHCEGAVALVTGRALASVDALLAPLLLPAAGLHGAQLRRDAAAVTPVAAMPGHAAVMAALRPLCEADSRLVVEDKVASVALHYRLAPERAQACNATMQALGRAHGLNVIVGHCVVEARTPGIHKGTAVADFLGHAPFAGRRPVFVGDDTTDEDGFAVVNRRDGLSIKVGEGPTQARFRLASVTAVHQWLADAVEGLTQDKNHGRFKPIASDGPAG